MKAADQRVMRALIDGTLTREQRQAIGQVLTGKAGQGEATSLLLSQAQVARLLSVSRFTVYRLEKVGVLRPVFLTPDLKRFRRDDIENLALGGAVQPAGEGAHE